MNIKHLNIEQVQTLCTEIEYKLKHNKLDELTKQLMKAFLDYGRLTIISRAFPRVEDGLKPVHRRILYSMNDLGLTPSSPHKKSARISGHCIGIYHSFGDSSVYSAMVRMAQDFSMRLPLVDGQGNFGTIEGDSPASSRYTEATVTKAGGAFFRDLEKDVIHWNDNYDETTKEPEVLPVRYPNLLINGSNGIAVGMTTSIPPHNPLEVIEATKYLIDIRTSKNDYTVDEFIKILPAPDFPTGGIVYNTSAMKDIATKGSGRVRLRAVHHIEKHNKSKKESIIITEIPFMVKIPTIFNKLKEIINNIKGEKDNDVFQSNITDVRNESSNTGIRIVIDLKVNTDAEIIWNQIVKVASLDITVSYIPHVIDSNNELKLMSLRDILESFIDFRLDIILKKYIFIKDEKMLELEIVEGFIKSLSLMDTIIKLIRNSDNDDMALLDIIELGFTERQAKAILNLRLARLTKLEDIKLLDEKNQLEKIILNANKLINSDKLRYNEIVKDLDDSLKLFTNATRLTKIDNSVSTINNEDLVKNEECIVYISNIGYIRREPIESISKQARNTKGKKKFELSENDYITQTFNTNSHSILLFITDKGLVYATKAYNIPDNIKGRFVSHLFDIPATDKVIRVIEIDELDVNILDNIDLVMATKLGFIKKTNLNQYVGALRKGGIVGINLGEDDEVRHAAVVDSTNENESMLISSDGKLIRFDLNMITSVGRNSRGVIGMRLEDNIEVLDGLSGAIKDDSILLTIGKNGTIKATNLNEYKIQKRAGKGVIAMKVNNRTGSLLKAILINELDNDLVVTSKQGITNRIHLQTLKIQARKTSGIKAMNLSKDDVIVDGFIVNISDSDIGDIEESKFKDVRDIKSIL